MQGTDHAVMHWVSESDVLPGSTRQSRTQPLRASTLKLREQATRLLGLLGVIRLYHCRHSTKRRGEDVSGVFRGVLFQRLVG